MNDKWRYHRDFFIFEQEDSGFGSVKEPSGYLQLEFKNGKGKVSVNVQNLREDPEKITYKTYLVRLDDKEALTLHVGDIFPQRGRGELKRDFEPAAVGGDVRVDSFNCAVILARYKDRNDPHIICPLASFKSKKNNWREILRGALYPRKDDETQIEKDETAGDSKEAKSEKIRTSKELGSENLKDFEEKDFKEKRIYEESEDNAVKASAIEKTEDEAEELLQGQDVVSKYTMDLESKYVPYSQEIQTGQKDDAKAELEGKDEREEKEREEKEREEEKRGEVKYEEEVYKEDVCEEEKCEEAGYEEEKCDEVERAKEKCDEVERAKEKCEKENGKEEDSKERADREILPEACQDIKEEQDKEVYEESHEKEVYEESDEAAQKEEKEVQAGEGENGERGNARQDVITEERTEEDGQWNRQAMKTVYNCPLNNNCGGAQVYNVNSSACENCISKNMEKAAVRVESSMVSLERLSESFGRYFEAYNPFGNRKSNYRWWKVSSPVYLNNILYQHNIKTPLLFNPSVMMSYFKYRHLIIGVYSDKVRQKEYIVAGIPGVYNIDEKPFGDLCRWVQLEGYRPRYGAFGYWLVYMDPKTGRLLKVK